MTELRKVQRTPTGTFFVCLPRTWSKTNGLKKGDLVDMRVDESGKLVVDPKYQEESSPRTTCLNLGPYLSREIVGNYLLGSDIIQIIGKGPIDAEARKLVKDTVGSLVGLEIVEENYSQIILQCLLEPSGFPPEKILRRNYTIVAGMHRDAISSFIESNQQLAQSVIARDEENNRLYFLLVRNLRTIIQNPRLSEKLGLTAIECLDYRSAASFIETIGDSCVQIASKTLEIEKTQLSEDLKKLFYDLQLIGYDAHEQAIKAFMNKDISLAEKVRKSKEKVTMLLSEIENECKIKSPEFMPQVLTVGALSKQIYEHSIDLADLVI